MDLGCAYFGVITHVYPPSDPHNISKYQYEYGVTATLENYSQVPVSAVRMDKFGQHDDYEDAILSPGTQVILLFPRGDISMGLIIGGSRRYKTPIDSKAKAYYRQRFNKIETAINSSETWSVKHDAGPTIQVGADKIVISDSAGEQIVLDKAAKTLTINTKTWKVNVTGDANINVTGAATVKAGKDVNVTAGGNATIKGKKVNLIGGGTGITTKASHQGVIDLITGVPVSESKKIFGDM